MVPHMARLDTTTMQQTSTSLSQANQLAQIIRISIEQRMVTLFAFLVLLVLSTTAAHAQSKSDLQGIGPLQFDRTGVSTFTITGTETHLNRFVSKGEIHFTPDSKIDGAMSGTGVTVFYSSNGDQLVGNVALITDSKGNGSITVAWRDSVRLANGTTVYSTGKFQSKRPDDVKKPVKKEPHTVVIAIIAILIG